MVDEEAPAAFKKPAFKKRGPAAKPAALRKRARQEGAASSDEDQSGVAQVEKKKKMAVNSFSTGRRKTAGAAAEDSDDEAAASTTFKSTRDAMPVKTRGGATDYNESETAMDRDARAILERSIALQAEEGGEAGAEGGGPKVYKGQAGYKQHIAKSQSQVAGNKHTGTQGPIRAPQYARTTSVFDYQPDICKDYKETGYCGFGDSCKFMHDRGDYKAGWQQEREWEEKQKKRRAAQAALEAWGGEGERPVEDDDGSGDDKYAVDEDGDLPFACFICREAFRDPVVTNCGHHFCEACAMDNYKRSTRCAACGKQTGGVFNFARRLVEHMAKKGLVKAGGGGGGGDDDEFAVREEVELTAKSVVTKQQGGWQTVSDD
ncbi:hypothetical protein JKP88DRAFT_229990 [Tribonema minus]|uniref:Uncharacterized protein n=1 Tax=Tribonema minus TaxID=303371 RepID=A0A836CP80_9STRA|nr:hypothetical protein JKP88DRAFT_229990 [Tribonema minus]